MEQELIDSKFANLNRQHLRKLCKEAGIAIAGNATEALMRKKLCVMSGVSGPSDEEVDNEPDKNIAPMKRVEKKNGVINLSPTGDWGGKCFLVTIECSDSSIKTAFAGWNGESRNLEFGVEYVLPAPYVRSLQASVSKEAVQKPIKDPTSGATIGYTTSFDRRRSTFMLSVQDHPPTQHLPECFLEYAQSLAKASNNFDGWPRKKLGYIFTNIFDHYKAEDIRGMTDDEIKEKILTTIVPNYGVENFDLGLDFG